MTCIFIFRLDLLLTDNKSLIQACAKYEKIIPIFIYDYHFFTAYHKFFHIQELGLLDLEKTIAEAGGRLMRFYGKPYKVIRYLIKKYKVQAVAYNKDYSVYSMDRDTRINLECGGLDIIACDDVTIYAPAEIKAKYNNKYGTFVQNISVLKFDVQKNRHKKYTNIKDELEGTLEYAMTENKIKLKMYKAPFIISRAGAIEALKKYIIPKTPPESEPRFMEDMPEVEITGRDYNISPHLKLGLISAREVMKYSVLNKLFDLTRNILWREFYFANWLARQNHYSFYDGRFNNIEWLNDKREAWAMWAGKTGFPIIDAAMREINETGFMWNRARLFVGFFSVKILRLHPFGPLGGQKYFSEHLIDCCYANNTGNWHWVASDTVDASGMRFGHGFGGRPMNVYKLTEQDKKYIEKWAPKKCKEIVNFKTRLKEWYEMTSEKN